MRPLASAPLAAPLPRRSEAEGWAGEAHPQVLAQRGTQG